MLKIVVLFQKWSRLPLMSIPRRYVITRHDQLATIVSPVRQEILDVMARLGVASLAEIAAILGRPADGLYYHVRALLRVGLLQPAGLRRAGGGAGGRSEALVRAAASEFALQYAGSPPKEARAATAIVGSMLRLGTRDFRRGLLDPGNVLNGPGREVWALRSTGWLSRAEVAGVNRRIRALNQAVRVPGQGKGKRLYAVTILLTPLDRKPRRRATSQRGVS